MMNKNTAILLSLAAGLAAQLHAQDKAPKADRWGIVVPDSISELSATAKVGYDSNVYCTEFSPAGKPDVSEVEALVFGGSVKALFNGAKLFDVSKDSALKTLSFGYTGDYTWFEGESDEDNFKHALPFALTLKQGDWSASLSNTLLYIDGSKNSPFYSTYSAYGTATARERREQFQNRFATSLRYDQPAFFVRAVGSSLTYDLRTLQTSLSGWQNWVDRYDMNAGGDLGYKVKKDLALVGAFRIGKQWQDRVSPTAKYCNSTYTRLLLGFEGKLTDWLSGNVLVGPDFRNYSDKANLGLTGVQHTWAYGEGSLSAKAGAADTLTLTGKAWHWVSSTGATSYQDASYQLTWKHAFNKQLSASAGLKWAESDYDAPATRVDRLWTVPLNVTWNIAKEISLSADYILNSAEDSLSTTVGREYDQHLFSISLKLSL